MSSDKSVAIHGNVKQRNWALRRFDGVEPMMTPRELFTEFVDYMEFIKKNPIYVKVIQQKTGSLIDVPKARVMTIKGFCLYAGLSNDTLTNYASNDLYKDIVEIIKDSIYCNKFEGAAVGVFNATIIMRDIGLTDSVSHTLEDKRKSINQLFPSAEEIEAVEVEATNPEDTKKLNEKGFENG